MTDPSLWARQYQQVYQNTSSTLYLHQVVWIARIVMILSRVPLEILGAMMHIMIAAICLVDTAGPADLRSCLIKLALHPEPIKP